MAGDFEGWLDALLEYCELPISPSLRQELLGEAAAKRRLKENPNRHLRKGRPGDHVNKLRADTIEYLNERFAPVLEEFGYR
jgi:hypothetical protein